MSAFAATDAIINSARFLQEQHQLSRLSGDSRPVFNFSNISRHAARLRRRSDGSNDTFEGFDFTGITAARKTMRQLAHLRQRKYTQPNRQSR